LKSNFLFIFIFEKQFPAMRLVKLELEIFRWGLVVFRFGWCVSEAEGRRICATP